MTTAFTLTPRSFVLRALLPLLVCAVVLTRPAAAQSLCDLIPASAMQAALGISDTLVATPNTEGGNGCDYKSSKPGPTVVIADSSDAAGMMGMIFNQRMSNLSAPMQKLTGVGESAYYSERHHEQIVKYPNTVWSQQSVVFRGKGKIVSIMVRLQGSGVPKATIVSLATLALSKPLNTLKDPK